MNSLHSAIRKSIQDSIVAVRVKATLAPTTGGSKILPPTYAIDRQGDSPHNLTKPNESGASSWVSIDSPGSFANRVESALVAAELGLDPLRVTVGGRTVSTMQLPHRCFDAVLRDSTLKNVPFRKTDIGKAVTKANAINAKALLQYDPSVLLFGGWDSTELGMAGGVGNRWPAALSAEISATDALPIKRAGNRVDPLGIEGTKGVLVEEEDGTLHIATENEQKMLPAKEKKPQEYPRLVKPSEVNHGNILSLREKGVLVRGTIELHGALSLTRLRRYRFDDVDAIDARTVLALAGIYGVAAVLDDGLDLRRDCDLVPETVSWELVGAGRNEAIKVAVAEAREALQEAIKKVPISAPVVFKATSVLEYLVSRYVA